jgi:hypothetical protein
MDIRVVSLSQADGGQFRATGTPDQLMAAVESVRPSVVAIRDAYSKAGWRPPANWRYVGEVHSMLIYTIG